ncbi:MAG: hypothetical protein IK143_06580 [Bacteroidales bacterium]|nr:hypothetical protein [Bacteroidales bacterium]
MLNSADLSPQSGLAYESPFQETIALCPHESLLDNSPQDPLEPINPGQGHDW